MLMVCMLIENDKLQDQFLPDDKAHAKWPFESIPTAHTESLGSPWPR